MPKVYIVQEWPSPFNPNFTISEELSPGFSVLADIDQELIDRFTACYKEFSELRGILCELYASLPEIH